MHGRPCTVIAWSAQQCHSFFHLPLPNFGMWYDSILKLKWDFTFNFNYPENKYKSKEEQPQDPNQLWTWMIYCYKGTSSYVTYAKIVSKHPQDTKDPLPFLLITKNMPVFIGPFCKKIINMDFPGTMKTTVYSMTKLGKWWPNSFPP